jgi:glucose/arabinose dehydrogenase
MKPTLTPFSTRSAAFCSMSACLLLVVACGGGSSAPSQSPSPGGGSGGPSSVSITTEKIASGLTVPWSLQFAPDGRLFFTERIGDLRVFSNGAVQSTPVYDKTSVSLGGLDGMTGMVLDPDFGANHRIYVFYCFGKIPNEHCRVERLIESNGTATLDKVLIDFTTINRDHIGGRLKIGPDNLLYLTTGDQKSLSFSQDPSSLAGKILRMDFDGNAMGAGLANPYVYALGFRDPEGLAWDNSGALYGTDHGPVSNDEVNLIEAGQNYGWPACIGICNDPKFRDPVKLWQPETAAPSGTTFYNSSVIPQWNGSMLIALMGLTNNTYAHHLHRIQFSQPGSSQIASEEVLFKDQFGRLRDVVQGPDGFVYFSTSNGNATDVIVRVKPQ